MTKEYEFRKKWKLKRMGKGITQKEIAKVVGFSESMISKYERNIRDFDDDKRKIYQEYIENKK